MTIDGRFIRIAKLSFKSTLFYLLLVAALQANAQLGPTQYQKIDSLFLEWNRPNHPGGVIGVMQNGEIIFSRAYGLASLEYLVPNSTETIFNTASVSKQFTSMGIVLLHLEGKLSVDDDIRKYIPELHDFGETVTIRHMLHHTSGLRSLHAMLRLAGWRADDSRTNEDLYRFMEKQRELNFKPGDEYLYCNTGFIFMARIIEAVTDEKFTDWMKTSVFQPLGMTNTYVEDIYQRVVPNNATSYYGSYSKGFDRAVEYWGYTGSGNMHSTVNDLLKWSKNFYDPKPGWKHAFAMLQTVDEFNSGEINSYAFGINMGEFNGIKKVQHGGSIGGFRSNTCTYPDQQLNIAILTNFSSSGVSQKVNAISKLLLTGQQVSEVNNASHKTIKLSEAEFKKYEAFYWNDKSSQVRKMYIKNDTLRYSRSGDNESPLLPIGNDRFLMAKTPSSVIVQFEIGKNGAQTLKVFEGNKVTATLERFTPEPNTLEKLMTYTGKFYSPELETSYRVELEGGNLVVSHPRHGESEVEVLKKDILDWSLGIARYQRNENGEVSGVRISNGRARNVWFEKTD